MKIKEIHFLEYLGNEEQNLLTSIINFRSEFDLFNELDRVYQEPIKRLDVPDSQSVIPQLYLFVHFHLYFSLSCILRSHLSECFSSVRKGIDASLSAYRIILEPSSSKQYIDRDKTFLFIKRHIESEIKKDPSKYPLAHQLIKLHENCSQFGSHADIDSFIHRFEIIQLEEVTKVEKRVHYFQFPKDFEEYRFYYLSMLQSFYLMFKIFRVFFNRALKIINPQWELAIQTLGPKLERLAK